MAKNNEKAKAREKFLEGIRRASDNRMADMVEMKIRMAKETAKLLRGKR